MAGAIDLAGAGTPAGFADPVHEAQAVFRALLAALSRPGRCEPAPVQLHPPSSIPFTLAAAALTLIDQDVTAWLSPSLSTPDVRDYLVFHTGSRLVAVAGQAHFVLCANPAEIPPLASLAQGTPEYPDRSATVLVVTAGSTPGPVVTVSGPGIERPTALAIPGFDKALWCQLQANNGAYPLGIDVIVCTADGFIGLPRSTRIEIGG